MHPILRDRKRLAAYVGGWLLLGLLLALALTVGRHGRMLAATALIVPVCVVYAFVCLAAWYPCRSHPLGRTAAGRLLAVHLAGALLSAALWQGAAWAWATGLDQVWPALRAGGLLRADLTILGLAGFALYLLAVVVHYLALAFEASQRAERRSLELRLHARQAELEAFKAQIDPHFLFNCLNSISSLCGSDPAAARRTAIRLGELLRATLRLGSRDAIALSDELALARAYLDVERARFGDRLVCREEVDPCALDRLVPALLLQPLLENALKHGIAHRLEGGEVEISARADGGGLDLVVANPCAPDRPASDGAGIGLANVRGRLRLLYDGRASFRATDTGDRFVVEIGLPPPAEAAP